MIITMLIMTFTMMMTIMMIIQEIFTLIPNGRSLSLRALRSILTRGHDLMTLALVFSST